MKKDKCGHIYANLTMCQNTDLREYSAFCKTHISDVDGGSKAAKIQDKRFTQLRKTVRQIRDSLGFSFE